MLYFIILAIVLHAQCFFQLCICMILCEGFFAYTIGCLVVVEDLLTGEQKHLQGQSVNAVSGVPS